VQVGDEGDGNRILNSDPVLWAFAGDVNGRTVLDAGCGTGYLSKKLCDQGAHVTGIDFSERMIEIARAHYPAMDFRVDSCTQLATIDDEHFDLVIANYVLMDGIVKLMKNCSQTLSP
jgi:2-polyprenyl-3-methyl-5-hydroxy-6-metoxy-1,4-benzoquinol methylase